MKQSNALICLNPEPPLDQHMPFFTSVSLVLVKNKVTRTKYQLKLSALCDLLEILCILGLEASESAG